MIAKKDTIACDEHGEAPVAYVCKHLCDSKNEEAVGFYQPDMDLYEEQHEYSAWCKVCEDKLSKAGGEWNELLEKQADIKVICLSCFDDFKYKQMALNPADMILTYLPENKNIDKFYGLADAQINLANANKDEKLKDTCESFSFAAARFAAFEATLNAKDIEQDKEKIIDYYTLRFNEMFIDNLNDYIENKDEYLTKLSED